MNKKTPYKHIANLLVGTMLLVQVPMAVQAAMVPTHDVMQASQASMNKSDVVSRLQQPDVQEKLVQLGADPATVMARVQNMTPAELAMLNERMQQLPAGEGGEVLGFILVVVIILMITDAIGLTDVFNFIDPV